SWSADFWTGAWDPDVSSGLLKGFVIIPLVASGHARDANHNVHGDLPEIARQVIEYRSKIVAAGAIGASCPSAGGPIKTECGKPRVSIRGAARNPEPG